MLKYFTKSSVIKQCLTLLEAISYNNFLFNKNLFITKDL